MSWPWKKKSSDKQAVEKADTSATAYDIGTTQENKGKQDNNSRNTKFVQLSIESHEHLIGLEDQMKLREAKVQKLEDEVTQLKEKLFGAQAEITEKENLVKQHAKVVEEAVSGWEKAEAEAATLKYHLESVTLLKLNAEDKASHLDGALKECMRQIRSLKEEYDQKLNEVILNRTKVFDEMKQELEAKIASLNQQIWRSAAENDALSISLQEYSDMVIRLREEKSQANAEIELLKTKIESCEKEVNSLKYELHIASKEVEIRNEEKNMSVRSAEVANKQHLDGVKKIAKLEAECQRLRGLVRKKLPGPAALAQMKLEVENLGREYGDSRFRGSQRKLPISQLPEFSVDNPQKLYRENELLVERLLAMDEQIRMLKEALSQCNGELRTSRSLCTDMASNIQSLETQLQANGEHGSPLTFNSQGAIEGFSYQKASNPSRFAVDDGNDDNISYAGSLATVSMSELSYIRDKNPDSPHESRNSNHMDLMDDFLEMEKLAYESYGSHATISCSDVSGDHGNITHELVKPESSIEVATNTQPGDNPDKEPPKEDATISSPQVHADPLIFVELRSRISTLLESISNEKEMGKVTDHVTRVMQDLLDSLLHQSENGVAERDHCCGSGTDLQNPEDDAKITTTGISSSEDVDANTGNVRIINQEVETAISHIYDFVMLLGKEAKAVPEVSLDKDGLAKNLTMLSAKYGDAIKGYINPTDFVLDISPVLHRAGDIRFNVVGFKSSELEASSSDCIDKIILPENKVMTDSSKEGYPNGCSHFSDSSSDPDIPNNGNPDPTSRSWKCSLEEFEQLKLEKENLTADLARCTENFESTKSQLLETEQLLAEVKSQLASAQNSNSLAETQLKCMAESYNSLEKRAEEFQSEIKLLKGKIETLDNELQEERKSHQDTTLRCNDLLEQLKKMESHTAADNDKKATQDELAAASEKLAECQQTIYLLSKQLKVLRPQTDFLRSPYNVKSSKAEPSIMDEHTMSGMTLQDIDSSESEMSHIPRSPYRSSKHLNNQPAMTGFSSTSSIPTPEKQSGRGFVRFFSSKGKKAY